jgi:glucose-fructose oxidoreductase
LSKSDQFAPELVYFSECVLTNRTPEPSGAEGIADLRIIEAMQRSIKNGRWVEVALTRERSSRKSAARKLTKRPTLRQEIRLPAIPREPKMVEAQSASQ